jgi:hypothetical protein
MKRDQPYFGVSSCTATRRARRQNVLVGYSIQSLGRPPLDDLDILLDIVLQRRLGNFLLDGGGSASGLLVVRGQFGLGGEAGRIGGEVVIQRDFELSFLEGLVAIDVVLALVLGAWPMFATRRDGVRDVGDTETYFLRPTLSAMSERSVLRCWRSQLFEEPVDIVVDCLRWRGAGCCGYW